MNDLLEQLTQDFETTPLYRCIGYVRNVYGLLIESQGPPVAIGSQCFIETHERSVPVQAEVVGFRNDIFYLMPYGDIQGLSPGCRILSKGQPLKIGVSEALKGRVLNGVGKPIDGKQEIAASEWVSVDNEAPSPYFRKSIQDPFITGIKSIDGCLTIGQGQRVGIFSGSGVGKSTLLGMIARHASADVSVVALLGERGREVKTFLEEDLGENGLRHTVVVVVTSDEPPLMKIKGAYTATRIAEYFRDQGKSVVLMMDSLTRIAMAGREVGLSIGEPPTSKGYPPSVFAAMPRLLERAGTSREGSITGLYSVLVEGDDLNDPIADTARSILDGHIVLSRQLASENHYPAIDVRDSVSRLFQHLASEKQFEQVGKLRQLLTTYEEARDLIQVGAYVSGSDALVDEAIERFPKITQFLKQAIAESFSMEDTCKRLQELFAS